jgi:hypothetical protein
MPNWSTGLIYLSEYHYGFSRTALGFPSISACRAIVYQTTEGLFGVHQATGGQPEKYPGNANKFARFVNEHPQGAGTGLNLYCAAKVGGGSAYSQGLTGAREHLAELKAIANELKFTGPVRSYDLSGKWSGPGVYVEVVVRGGICLLFGNPWVEHHDDKHRGGVPGDRQNDHKLSYQGKDEFLIPTKVFHTVDSTGQQPLEPIILEMR